jgi:hypothetical protein
VGVVMMFKRVVYAKDEDRFFAAWTALCKEFSDQDDILQYLQHQYISVYHQWAEHSIRGFLNYGQTTTSQSESSNHCIKTYSLSGKCDWYSLVKALREMVRNHKRSYNQAVAHGHSNIRHMYVGKAYLGDLPMVLTCRALDMIHKEYVRAQAALKNAATSGHSGDLPQCGEHCTTWL